MDLATSRGELEGAVAAADGADAGAGGTERDELGSNACLRADVAVQSDLAFPDHTKAAVVAYSGIEAVCSGLRLVATERLAAHNHTLNECEAILAGDRPLDFAPSPLRAGDVAHSPVGRRPVGQQHGDIVPSSGALLAAPSTLLDYTALERAANALRRFRQAAAAAEAATSPLQRAPAALSTPVSSREPKKSYQKDEQVEYYSVSNGQWIPATVTKVRENGRLLLSVKPKAWLTVEEQDAKVRPRQKLHEYAETLFQQLCDLDPYAEKDEFYDSTTDSWDVTELQESIEHELYVNDLMTRSRPPRAGGSG